MSLPVRTRINLVLVALIIFVGAFGLAVTQGWFGDPVFSLKLFLIVLSFLVPALIVISTAISIRHNPERGAKLADFARRHIMAVLLLFALLAFLLAQLLGAGITSLSGGLVAFYFAAIVAIWLINVWRFETDATLRANTARLFREHRAIVILFISVYVLAALGWALWVQPFTSLTALQTFLSPLFYPLIFSTSFVTLLKSWPTTRGGRLWLLFLAVFYLGSFAFYSTAGSSFACEQADCGGWLLRSQYPASWADQQQAIDKSAAALEPGLRLTRIQARPLNYQPPNSAYTVLEVTFEYASANEYGTEVTIEDNAIDWKRHVDIGTGIRYPTLPDDLAPVLAQTKIGPSDVFRVVKDSAAAAGLKPDDYGPTILLLQPADAAAALGKPTDTPIWRAGYIFAASDSTLDTLFFYVDGTTGQILKQETK